MFIFDPMKGLLNILDLLYRLWFYVMIGVVTLVLFPFLFLTTISEKTYPQFYVVARTWSLLILLGMGFFPKVKRTQKLNKKKSYVVIANHSSMVDIMMMFWSVPCPFVFIGKKELAKMPLFGFFYSRSSILVDRENRQSKKAVFEEAQRRFKQGSGVCVFPEGGVPKDYSLPLGRFKDGAFRMAIEHGLDILPVILYDNKRKFPYKAKYGRACPGRLRAKIMPPISTSGLDVHQDKAILRQQTYDLILGELTHQ